ncbi:MAG TPA: SDR family oxidoreductase [Bacteroidetes bacterium]|nr:SDR family oxidoreductase [Bacteroidota bacterium]
MKYKNKTVWITGASSGIGEAMAYEFSKQGAKLILSSRKEAALRRVADRCGSSGTIIQTLDIADHASLPGTVEKVLHQVGKVDVLINNAGISQRSLVKDTVFEVDKKMIDVNLLGTIALSKAILPHFLENRSGHYIVISSLMGKFAAPMRSSYAAAKHGLHGFFDTLRAECFRENVKVTMVCPGFIRTDISKNALTADGSAQGTMDDATGKGMPPGTLAKKIADAAYRGKEEVAFGGQEVLAVYVKRFFPKLLNRIVRKAKVT